LTPTNQFVHTNPNHEMQRQAWIKLLGSIKSELCVSGGRSIFISYAWDDPVDLKMQRWLKHLQEDLQASGCEVFLDLSHMHDDMNVRMRQGIERSDVALIICTPRLKERASVDTNVAFELGTIFGRKQVVGESFHVLPLIYCGDFESSVPDFLKCFLVRDCTDHTRYKTQLTNLVNPLGIIPAILGVRRGGASPYEKLLSEYRVACLSNLPAPNVDFTGRVSLLEDLVEGFRHDKDTQVISHKPQAIGGLGGVGKTELALQYSHTHRASYDICRWIVSDGLQLLTSMRLFAEQAGIDVAALDDDKEVARQLYHYLSDHSWLLVFDNVEDAAAVKAFLPPAGSLNPHQHVLITSRSQAWARVLSVDAFSEAEAMTYINAHIDSQDQTSVRALVNALGGLPLALSQAIAYMRATGVTVSMYLELLRAKPMSAFSEVDEDLSRSYPHTVWSTWALSMVKIEQDPQAVRMLRACAWLAADNIPLYLFEDEALLGANQSVIYGTLKTLRAYSMVDVTKDGFIKIHRLVQVVLQDSMRGDDSSLVQVIACLSRVYPWHKRIQSDFDRTRDLLDHLEVVLVHADIRQNSASNTADWATHYLHVNEPLSEAYDSLGDAAKKKELLERALCIKEAYYGPNHIKVAGTLTNLGNAYASLGDAAKSKKLLERALCINEAHYGPDHVEVARTLNNLGNAYGSLGDAAKSKELLERAVRINEAHYGPDHVEVAGTLNSLGNAYGSLGDAAKKRELLERAVRIMEAYYGPDHVVLARVLHNLGNAYYGSFGDAAKMKELLERALRILETHYGPNHVVVAGTLSNLGTACDLLGDAGKGKELLERALRIKEAYYGPDHVEVAGTLDNLGNAYDLLGDAAKSKELLERAVRINEAHYGPDHVEVARTLNNLGSAYGSLGDAAKMQELLERALRILEAHYGPDHVVVAGTMNNLGSAYGSLGDAAKSKELLARALPILEAHYGPDNVQVAATLNSLGSAYGLLGDAAMKRELLERALRINEAYYGRDHVVVAGTLNNLGNAYDSLGDAAMKRELLERALRILEVHYGPDHVYVAETLFNLGHAWLATGGSTKEAKCLFDRAREIFEREYGEAHNHTQLAKEMRDWCANNP
jgi:tetratricopeptide (TPR) repeat protein